jgi:hypothetical protein
MVADGLAEGAHRRLVEALRDIVESFLARHPLPIRAN